MFPGVAKHFSQFRHLYFFIFLALLAPTGCQVGSERFLPTLVPTLELIQAHPTESSRATRVAPPATYTPVATPDLTLINQPTRAVTLVPQPLIGQSLAPTPIFIAGDFPQQVEALYLDLPPTRIDCQQRGLVFRSRFPSVVAGPWRDYHVYLPPCYGHDGHVYPVLYLIHGSIQDDSHWLDLGLAEYLDAGINSGRFPPFIAIMPNSGQFGNYTSGGWKSIEGITANSLVPYIDDNYCTWRMPAGRSIGGISRGGYWALEIAFKYPDLFGAVAGHSSHLRFETDPANYNPLATYSEANLSGMRIWLDRGEKDFLRAGQDQLHNLLFDAGINHVYRVNEGGHNEAYWVAHLAEYIDWHAELWPRDRLDYPLCP